VNGRVVVLWVVLLWTPGMSSAAAANAYSRWANGPDKGDGFFPIAVWLQNPARAPQYKAAGFNTYVGLWKGPTHLQLNQLKSAGMKVICRQNEVALRRLDDETIIGWMHGDEPDNAQPSGKGKGYGPPIPPAKIISDYERIRANDPSRPVLLNLGQGVAWDGWYGRGVRTNHPEDYPEYVKGCDIASFDIYPAAHSKPQVAGKLWYVARGVERLVEWTGGRKIVWNCIECTRIHNPTKKATPHQVRAEVWMSIIHGSMGLIYFVHEWQPRFNESAILGDPEMLAAITRINKQITALAPVLNSPTIAGGIRAVPADPDVPIAVMMKRHKGAVYVFAVAMRQGSTKVRFGMTEPAGTRDIEVLGENRKLTCRNGIFEDEFGAWDVHLYKADGQK